MNILKWDIKLLYSRLLFLPIAKPIDFIGKGFYTVEEF